MDDNKSDLYEDRYEKINEFKKRYENDEEVKEIYEKINEFKKIYENEEFKEMYENKRRKMMFLVCLTRLFCCPCIAVWNISRLLFGPPR